MKVLALIKHISLKNLLPLNRRRRLAGDVVDYSVHAGDLGYDAAGDAG